MAGGLRADDVVEDSDPAPMGAGLVARHQDRIADDIDKRDRRESSAEAWGGLPSWRAIWHAGSAYQLSKRGQAQLVGTQFVLVLARLQAFPAARTVQAAMPWNGRGAVATTD